MSPTGATACSAGSIACDFVQIITTEDNPFPAIALETRSVLYHLGTNHVMYSKGIHAEFALCNCWPWKTFGRRGSGHYPCDSFCLALLRGESVHSSWRTQMLMLNKITGTLLSSGWGTDNERTITTLTSAALKAVQPSSSILEICGDVGAFAGLVGSAVGFLLMLFSYYWWMHAYMHTQQCPAR